MLKFSTRLRAPMAFAKSSLLPQSSRLTMINPGMFNMHKHFSTKKEDFVMTLPKDEGRDCSELAIGVPTENLPGENRVAISPTAVKLLTKKGFTVNVEKGAGHHANFLDSDYVAEGANIVSHTDAMESDIVFKVREPSVADISEMKQGATSFSFFYPAQNQEIVAAAEAKGVTSFAMDCVPRISRAQVFDALSSMANISGYKAVIESAHHFGRLFTGQMTAAGKTPPAKVLVIGAGVAGLSAIVTAKSLGAIVRGFDTRPAALEQIAAAGAEPLTVTVVEDGSGSGGYAKEMSPEFIAAEMALFKKQAAECDIIITTALIPGRPAPKLILREAVDVMRPGSVIIDLAAQNGGNCEYTVPNEVNIVNGVKVVGYTDFPSRMANQSSNLYANNISKLLASMVTKDNKFHVDMTDEVVRGSVVTWNGQMCWPNPNPPMLDAKPGKKTVTKVETKAEPIPMWNQTMRTALSITGALTSIVGLGVLCPTPEFLAMSTTFTLAVVAGYQSVWGVSPALHTPLMSVTNAISGITAIGGLCMLGGGIMPHTIPQTLAAASVLVSAVNIFGGFIVTKRMLDMFKRKTDPEEYNMLYSIPAAATIGKISPIKK